MSQIANYFVLKRLKKNKHLRHDMFNDFLRRSSMTSLSLHGLSYNPQAALDQHILVLINSNNSNF